MPKAVLGIDPGSQGALCYLTLEGHFHFLDLADINARNLYIKLDSLRQTTDNLKVIVEKVHSIPRAASNATWKFGYNVGELHATLKIALLGFDYVQPKQWQKLLGVPAKAKGKDVKKHTAECIIRLYPEAEEAIYTPRGRLLDGRSDALGIAHYGLIANYGKLL